MPVHNVIRSPRLVGAGLVLVLVLSALGVTLTGLLHFGGQTEALWMLLSTLAVAGVGGLCAWPLWRVLVLGQPDRSPAILALGMGLVGLAGALPPAPGRLLWTWGPGPSAGDMVRPDYVTAWGQRHLVFELMADPVGHEQAGQGLWRAEADLASLPGGVRHRLVLMWTQPEDTVFDPQSRQPLAGGEGMRIVLRTDEPTGEPLTTFVMNLQQHPDQRTWQRAELDVSAASRRLVVEAIASGPEGPSWFNRVWLDARPPKPLFRGRTISGDLVRTARGLTWAWGLLVLSQLVRLITRALRGRRPETGISPAIAAGDDTQLTALVAFVVAAVLYYPLVMSKHAFADDYRFLFSPRHDLEALIQMISACGRFISALLTAFAYSQIETVAQLSILRGVGALGMATCAALLAVFLKRRGWTGVQAITLGLLICTTPSACLAVGWAQLFPVPLAILLSLLAFELQLRMRWPLGGRSAAYGVGAVAALCASFCLYQPWAMFYLVWVILDALPTPGRPVGRWWLLATFRAALVFGASAILAFVSIVAQSHPNSRSTPLSDPATKLRWFLDLPLHNALAMFRLAPCDQLTYGAEAVILLGLLCYVERGERRAALAVLAMVLAFPVVYLPNLVIADSWPAYRSLFALSALVIVTAAFALRGILVGAHSTFSAMLVVLTGLSLAAFAYQGRVYLQEPHGLEFRLLVQTLRKADPSRTTAIYMIRPNWSEGPVEQVWYDEFGLASSHHHWSAPFMIWAASREFSEPARRALGDLPVTSGTEPVANPGPGVFQIDMRALRLWRAALH